MNTKQYQNAAGAVVGSVAETLESYSLPESLINTVKKIIWAEIDKRFGGLIDEE